ncbi:hypothetical protein [Pararhizobium sp. A13]|uniref:hypothetical protein n=1 Tax=Pararhizobium sp. A13 TaxID=3133975 RepID=UPI00311B1D72
MGARSLMHLVALSIAAGLKGQTTKGWKATKDWNLWATIWPTKSRKSIDFLKQLPYIELAGKSLHGDFSGRVLGKRRGYPGLKAPVADHTISPSVMRAVCKDSPFAFMSFLSRSAHG